MTTKKKRGKREEGGAPERIPPLSDDRKRFGAVAFFDSRVDSDDSGGEEFVLSFDALREAFASAEQDQCSLSVEQEKPESSDESISENEDAVDLNPKIILEAMLFIGDRENRPLTAERAAEGMRNVSPTEIDTWVQELNRNYDRLGCPYHIVGDRGGYQMVLRPEFETIRGKFYGRVRETTLSQQAIDTLAIVAYRQPICAEDVQQLRKEPCASILSLLVRRGLLTIERETRNKKRVPVYRTTERFLELFRLDSLDELPFSDEQD